ncbi:MAG: YhcH/YjgK/YiaL family protein [Bacteroides sp.]
MKHIQWLCTVACLVLLCLPAPVQGGKKEKTTSKEKSVSVRKWVRSGVWNEGLKAKPHQSTRMAEFKTQYEANTAQWKAAFRWLATHDLTAIAKGRYPIEGTSMGVSVEDSFNEPLAKRGSEAHRKHIDLQYVVKGTERFGLLDHASSTPNCAYNEERDAIYYDFDPAKTTFIDSVPGEFFLFFPDDWHIAKIATDKEDQRIRVIVIKLDYIPV